MATAPEDRPLPDQIEGAPHPSATPSLIGQFRAEADFLEAQAPAWTELKRCRERDECREKLVSLGLFVAVATS